MTDHPPAARVPQRIQRKRTKGWRMPEGVVYVGRGSKWGNPHKVGISLHDNGDGTSRYMTVEDAIAAYRDEYLPFWMEHGRLSLHDLRGKDLACWCPLVDKDGNRVPCHADVLLELANV